MVCNQDPYDLNRFVEAHAANYDDALAELRAGRKRTHWSWYVFPQICGLGSSAMSVRYAIGSLAEAVVYLQHPVLGPRLRECVASMNSHHGPSATDILGGIDAQKLHSCLTLFIQAAPSEPVFNKALHRYFGGEPDAATLHILAN
ncbi:MAG: DUF1810 domain-containing protein [Proteobacteria bacterium]|nr:DUF1810 domain-containing protein [Pseudomonadota bacterium]